MITYKYIKAKDVYVFSKNGINWALSPKQIEEMHQLTGELLSLKGSPAPTTEEK